MFAFVDPMRRQTRGRAPMGPGRSLPQVASSLCVAVVLVGAQGCAALRARAEAEDPQAVAGKDPYALHRALGLTLLQTGQPAEALPHFRRLERMRPENPEPHYLMARVFMRLGLSDPAEAYLNQALAIEPDYAAAHALIGVLLDGAGRHEEAAEAHLHALELEPDHAPYHNNMGFNLFVRERYEEAVEAYRRAVALEPRSRRVHNNLGFAYGRLGSTEKAWVHFQRGGPLASARNNLGMVYEDRGDLEAAHELYLAAAMEQPGLEAARRNLARVSERLGRPVPALEPEGEKG